MLSLVTSTLALNIGARVAPMRAPAVNMQVTAAAPAKVGDALETVELTNGDSSATVYKFGACVTSYKKGDTDYLMVRPDAKMDGSKPISGGIPHCFPQFGPGAIQQHGFARNLDWDVLEQSDEKVVFELTPTE